MQANLIDLYRFMVHPIVVHKGARLFAEGIDPTVLKLTHHQTFDSGIVILEYQPVRESRLGILKCSLDYLPAG